MSKESAVLIDPLNPLTEDFLHNPYPQYARLRSEAPVFFSKKNNYWLVSKYADVVAILRDLHYEKGLQNANRINPLVKMLPPVKEMMDKRKGWMLNQNPPDHTRLRSLVNKAFTPTMVNKMRDHIQKIANELLDAVQEKGEMDLVEDYAFPLPVTVISEMLGVPAKDRDQIKAWSRPLIEALEPSMDIGRLSRANDAENEMAEYLRPLVEDRRKNGQNDLISALVAAEEDGSKLTMDELLGNCILLLVAGHETTVNLIGNTAHNLLINQNQLELLKEKPDLIVNAIFESLRYESPVQTVRRLTADNMEFQGHKMKQHDTLILLLGAANRDEEQFENADKLDITRPNSNKHLAFGGGIHHCLGSSLAEVEGQIAINTLLKRMPNLKLKSTKIEFKRPFALRGPRELLVSF
jgi:cytochrome P450